jgi:hypothetical protein
VFVVKIPSLSRRTATAPTRDENRDGRIDERDVAPPDRDTRPGPVTTDRDADERRAADRAATDRAVAGRGRVDRTESTTPDSTVTDATTASDTSAGVTTDTDRRLPPVDRAEPVRPVEPTTVGPRPRASLLATLSLVVGVAAALFVLAGVLAGYGIALGVLGAVLAFGGFSATRRRHIAGRSDALFGLLLSLGAILVGILALSGQYDWPNADADTVARFREWLDSQFIDRF